MSEARGATSPALLPNVRVIPPQPFAPSGKGRLARVPQAAPCGHFASLVRSIATQSARLPSESFAFFGAFLRAISPCVAIFYDAAARRLHLPCRPASVRIMCGIKALVLAGEGEDFIRTVISGISCDWIDAEPGAVERTVREDRLGARTPPADAWRGGCEGGAARDDSIAPHPPR